MQYLIEGDEQTLSTSQRVRADRRAGRHAAGPRPARAGHVGANSAPLHDAAPGQSAHRGQRSRARPWVPGAAARPLLAAPDKSTGPREVHPAKRPVQVDLALPFGNLPREAVRTQRRELVLGDPARLPFGNLPRLLLAWVCSEAVRTQRRELVLGRSLYEFMHKLGMDDRSGGRHGALPSERARLKNQMARLFTCSVQLIYTESEHNVDFVDRVRCSEGIHLVTRTQAGDQVRRGKSTRSGA